MSADVVIEDVPQFIRRYGDAVYEGSNNTIIILGTDRAKKGPASKSDGLGHVKGPNKGAGTGTIHIIAGRAAKDPDLDKDDAFIYLTRKSKVDDNLGLGGVEQAQNDKPGAIVKSDLIRIVGRKDIKICANDDDKHYIFMDGKKIKIKFGSNFVEIDDNNIKIDFGQSKATLKTTGEISIKNSSCEINMNGPLTKVKAPTMHLTGGCEVPYDTLFTALDAAIKGHNHLTVVGPSLPTPSGPLSTPLLSTLATALATWKSTAKE